MPGIRQTDRSGRVIDDEKLDENRKNCGMLWATDPLLIPSVN